MLFMTIAMQRASRHSMSPTYRQIRAASTSAKSPATPSSPPPELERPFGFPTPPRKTEPLPTFMERTKSLLTRPNQQKKILEEEGASYWSDFHAMRVNEGKQWTAPAHLFKAERSLYFPNLAGRTLASEEADLLPIFGQPTLIRLFSATSGEAHVHGLGEGLGLQLVDVNIQTNSLKMGLLKLFMGRIKSIVEADRHDKYYILGSGWEQKLKVVGVVNSYVGYSFLLDKTGKIRWATCGKLTEQEKENLAKLSKRLIELGQ